MKTEKSPTQRPTEEVERQKFETEKEEEGLDLDKNIMIQEAKKLVSQGVAILNFEDSGFSKPKSVTVRRILDNSIIFYSKDLRDVEKFLN